MVVFVSQIVELVCAALVDIMLHICILQFCFIKHSDCCLTNMLLCMTGGSQVRCSPGSPGTGTLCLLLACSFIFFNHSVALLLCVSAIFSVAPWLTSVRQTVFAHVCRVAGHISLKNKQYYGTLSKHCVAIHCMRLRWQLSPRLLYPCCCLSKFPLSNVQCALSLSCVVLLQVVHSQRQEQPALLKTRTFWSANTVTLRAGLVAHCLHTHAYVACSYCRHAHCHHSH